MSLFSRIPEVIDEVFIGGNIARRAKAASRLPPSLIPGIRRGKFRRLMRYVNERSPFYRRRFKEAGIDVRGLREPADLGDFFTTAQDLRDNPVEEFLCARPELGFETTGTTATTGKRVYFSRREAADMGRDGAVGLYNLGLRPETASSMPSTTPFGTPRSRCVRRWTAWAASTSPRPRFLRRSSTTG